MKKCTKCHKSKPLTEFNKDKKSKDGLNYNCKECQKVYRKEHKEEIIKSKKINYIEHKEKIREKQRNYYQEHREDRIEKQNNYYHNRGGREKMGCQSMYKNKNCANYLGVVIGERLIRHLFKDVKIMPHGNPKFDFICNKNMKIDVKSSCTKVRKNRVTQWSFNINKNTIADYFLCIAFDTRKNLNPLYLWLIPGHEINNKTGITISSTTIHKWDRWKQNIKNAHMCCSELKQKENKNYDQRQRF